MKKVLFLLYIVFPGCFIAHGQNLEEIWSAGMKMFEENNYHGTILKMNQLLKQIPDFSSAVYNRGIARLNLGDVEGACNDFKMAQKLGFEDNMKFVQFTCDPELKIKYLKNNYYKRIHLYPELGYRPRYTHADSLMGALRSERTCYDVVYYNLSVKIIPWNKRIEASNDIYFRVTEPCMIIQLDLSDRFTIGAITWNNQKLSYNRDCNALFIHFPKMLLPGEMHLLRVSYKGKPRIAPNPPWDGGFVWKRDKNHNHWVGVACEHLGASSWWPNKDHISDKPDSMLINIDVPEGYKAVANGTLRSTGSTEKGYERYSWFVSYPINNYNATFYMGKYVEFTDTLQTRNGSLLLRYNVLPYNLEIAKTIFKQVKEILPVYGELFGYYPFMRDGFGLVESPYEGMEHQTAIAYGNAYDKPKRQEYRNDKYDFIIVHEAAHEWWGNAVTAVDMADIWIHEGFSTYAEYLFLEKMFGKEEYLYEINNKTSYIMNFWPMVQNRDVNENSFAGNDVYTKGAMMLHCLRCTLGNDSLFFTIIRDFNLQNRFKTLKSDDFVKMVNQYTEDNYDAFFKIFLYDIKLPVLSYSFERVGQDMLFKYKWTGIETGFKMVFGIETDKKVSYRLMGTAEEQEILLENTSWFNFYNQWKGYEGCADNSLTYFRTSCTSL
jgi:aminopeptidase N